MNNKISRLRVTPSFKEKLFKTEFWQMYQEATVWFRTSFNLLLFGFGMGGLALGIYWLQLIWHLLSQFI